MMPRPTWAMDACTCFVHSPASELAYSGAPAQTRETDKRKGLGASRDAHLPRDLSCFGGGLQRKRDAEQL